MYATICKSVKNTDRNIYRMIVAGFTGQLRGWWDNYLTVEERALVIKAKAIDEGVDNLGMALVANREDAVYTLILTILEHFNGRFTNQNEIVRTLLNGLRCKTLGICTQEGLNMCNELRLSRQLKMDKLKEKSQLGDFCTQFGLPETFTHKKKKHKYHRYPNQDSPYRRKRSRYRSKEEREAKKAHRKATRFTKNRSKRDLADIKCYKCGKLGHIAPNCKLQKLKTLGLDDELRDKLYPPIVLGTPFINAIYPFTSIDSKGFTATYKDKEISYTFVTDPEKIKLISEQIAIGICAEHPSAFWNRKKHIVALPYEDNFSEDDIPTKSRHCQMNAELVEFCKKEIDSLLQKGLIKPSKSPWSCTTFYINNAAEKERGIPRL
uniref:CCHC-type domain-containing protein n=1 Tax=Nicotiana tabacum TaxID=4097 RepID=A0A1S4BTV8_TOBAC